MLVIRNKERIWNRAIPNTDFYVKDFTEMNTVDFSNKVENLYQIEVTDNRHIVYGILKRESDGGGYQLKVGGKEMIVNPDEIQNLDNFIKCLSYLLSLN